MSMSFLVNLVNLVIQMYLVIMMNVAIFVNVVILVDGANFLGHVIFENLVDLIIW